MSAPDPITKRCFNTLLGATAKSNYEQFSPSVMTSFVATSRQRILLLLSGSCIPDTHTYLGRLRQNGSQVSLWRLTLSDGSDDWLVRMSISEGRVDGFLITPAFC